VRCDAALSGMPIYYFVFGDDAGGTVQELPNDAIARQVARETLGQMVKDDAMSSRLRVLDQNGREVINLLFSATGADPQESGVG